MLDLAQRFSIFCFLDNHQYNIPPHNSECLLAAGATRSVQCQAGNALESLQQFIEKKSSWLFGHFAYDLKNEIEKLESKLPDHLHFPDLFFFEPEILFQLSGSELKIQAEDPDHWYRQLSAGRNAKELQTPVKQFTISQRFNKEEYIQTVESLRSHILRGDCYEINFCQEFFAENILLQPAQVYRELSSLSPNPFSALYRINDKWLICASPERFLYKKGKKLISQPIKGTSARMNQDEEKDLNQKEILFRSEKDRSENVMVVDLVRNDLSKVCIESTVQVDELFGVYSFPQVHQMISTVSGELKPGISFSEIIRSCFPMGSMTGAPKKKVMELIEQYERTRRGIFSGALGYISPGANQFDFNVIIRSLMYNAGEKYLSFQAGSGITFYSEPEKEWDECMLKAKAIAEVLKSL